MMIQWGAPNQHTILSHKKFSTLFYVIVATAYTLTHFVKYSHATIKNLFCALASGKDPRISNPHWANGQGAIMLDGSSGGW